MRGILVQPVTKTNAASAVATSSTTTMDGHNNNNSNNLTMNEHTGIEHIVTLSRGTNERIINAVKFSPNGRYLVAAGDSGTVVSYALPSSSISSSSNPMNNNLNYWTSIEKETDLNMKMLFNHSDDVMDISWSADSKRFVVCSLDHTLTVWENYTTHTTGTTTGGGGGGGGSNSSDDGNNWRSVHRSNKDHTHYIQGVTYDPKGVYLASMGSDRMVKVYTRKEISDRTLSAELAKYEIEENTTVGRPEAMEEESGVDSEERHGSRKGDGGDKVGIIRESKLLPGLLTNSTFALQNKIKTMKFLTTSNGKSTGGKDHRTSVDSSNGTTDMLVDEKDKGDSLKSTSITNAASAAAATTKRHHMFADELTLGSFFRRLSFTTDGAFLVVPAALWHGMKSTIEEKDSGGGGGVVGHPRSPTSVSSSSMSESSFCTYLFARHHFDQPYKVLTGLEKPSVVIRPNPVLFQLPPSAASSLASSSSAALPYRSIFAVLTTDTVVIYDTHHNRPIAMARGLHYAGLTDAAWSADGRTLFVTSSDGYISILSFGLGELGNVYVAPVVNIVERKKEMPDVVSEETNVVKNISEIASVVDASNHHQANPVSTENVMKEKAISEAVTTASAKKKVRFDDPLDDRSNQPDHLDNSSAINTLIPKKKKKKIAPTLLIGDTKAQQIDTSSDVEQKKRPANEEPPFAESEAVTTSVNILMAKKKAKITTTSSIVDDVVVSSTTM
jgi:chromatin assembly factor 1 subunit B